MAMPAPHSYAEWSRWLDVFASGGDDEAALQAMAAGRLDWTPGVANLFSERMQAVFDRRLKDCGARLDRSFAHSRHDVDVVRALLDGRRHFALLYRLANLVSLPEVLRSHLRDSLDKVAAQMQQSLEDSARRERADGLLQTLRHHDLRQFRPVAADAAAPPPVSAAAPQGAPAPSRRRLLLS